jgi:hypothetical protein
LQALGSSPDEQQQGDSDHFSSDYEGRFLDDISDMDGCDYEVLASLRPSYSWSNHFRFLPSVFLLLDPSNYTNFELFCNILTLSLNCHYFICYYANLIGIVSS